jgi:hypothetical protein
MGLVIVEVLAIDKCQNAEATVDRVRLAFEGLGFGHVPVELRRIRSRVDASSTPFAGSPTITVDGVDLFPGDGRTVDLACRVYVTPEGIAGLPTVDQIMERVRTDG